MLRESETYLLESATLRADYENSTMEFITEAVLEFDGVIDVNLIRQKSQQPARPP